MEIDKLIDLLLKAKDDELKNVKILRKDLTNEFSFVGEDITGYSYDFETDSIILFPEYF